MPSHLTIRYANLEDVDALAALAAKAFSDTYHGLDDPQEIADYVAENFNRQAVASVVSDPNATTLLAEVGTELAGYAVLARSEPPSCVSEPSPIELARFYLAEHFIGQGYGAQLMLAVHREARRQGAQSLWLGVYDRNVRAVSFYERSGFTRCGGKEFIFGGRLYIDPIYAAPVRNDA